MSWLRPIDIFQIVTTMLLLALGAVAAVHALMHRAWLAFLVGAVMTAYGIYRWSAIRRAFREARR